jgi:hypothetical protein
LEPGVHWRGTLISPNAEIVVNINQYTGQNQPKPYTNLSNRSEAYGAFYGKTIEVHQYNTIYSYQFNYDSLASMVIPDPNQKSSNANLSGLTISSGTLSPSFGYGTTSYTVSIDNGVSSINVTPTKEDANASITINGYSVNSGSSQTVSLNVGANAINIVVTAQDGTTKTYTVNVTRASGGSTTPTPISITTSNTTVNTVSGTNTYTLSLSSGNITTFRLDAADNITLAGVQITVNGTSYSSSGYSINNTSIASSKTVTLVITSTQARKIKIAFW